MARILLIDDEPLVRRTLQLALENAGHSVATAEDGEGGIALARTLGFDLLVTDVLMPGRDGLDTIMDMRRERPAMRILAISGAATAPASTSSNWRAALAPPVPWKSRSCPVP